MSARTHADHSRAFRWVAFWLIALASISYGLSFVSLGSMRVPVALAISAMKATLVAVFFMELIDRRFTNRFVLIASMTLVLTLIVLMAADVITRETPLLVPPQ